MKKGQLGAFVEHCDTVLDGAADQLLSGLDFAVKDIFDVAGCRTGSSPSATAIRSRKSLMPGTS